MEERCIKMEMKNPQKLKEECDQVESLPEAVLLDLEQMNERIDGMAIEELNYHLKRYSLCTEGETNTLRDELKNTYRTLTLSSINFSLAPGLLPYYVVIDFEATCEEPTPFNFRPEIIEFSAVLVSSKSQKIIDCFQKYCKPQINEKISDFCTKLTGITQEQVDSAETFGSVLSCFHSWLKKNNVGQFGIVTDGPWDMARYLYNQCYYSNIVFPKWGRKWINLKTVFRSFYRIKFRNQLSTLCLTSMLDYLNMEFVGRQHCGLDDAKNIARVLLILIYNGADIQFNEKIVTINGSWRRSHGFDNNKKAESDGHIRQNISHTTDRKNIVRAKFSTIQYHQPVPNYIKCKRDKQRAQVLLAMKTLSLSNSNQTKLSL